MTETAERILSGDVRAIARAATWIENRQGDAEALLSELGPHRGRALIVGITGPPGSGKSTLCDQLIQVLRGEGKKVAVLAVDPSSPFSGGALLGDRIRMQQHHGDPGVFIRSMATRGALGGLARATAETATLLDAAGFDVVIIETVGVGQGEIEIARVAQVTAVVLTPGTGDDVQAIKAGIMEIAQVFVINKADLAGAEKLERDIRAGVEGAVVVLTVASEGRGIAELLGALREARGVSTRHAESVRHLVLDHLGIAVRSIEESLRFYRDSLGFQAGEPEIVAQEEVRVTMLPLAGSRIELLEASEADSVIAKFIEKRGEGLHHIALKVPDLNATVERLRAQGARLLNEPRKGAGGHTYVFVHPSSTGGVLLELIQS
jgi:LAO/AO transport system kinase